MYCTMFSCCFPLTKWQRGDWRGVLYTCMKYSGLIVSFQLGLSNVVGIDDQINKKNKKITYIFSSTEFE